MSDCADLYPVLGHSFQDKKLLKQALTLGFSKHFSGYERLEFLGDRVLGVSVAEMLFTNYPREPEGDMARRFVDLTRAETLADIARDLRFDRYLILAEPK
ncbi:MAG TPA: ribonuclease III, partial [Alphaproteobacteria bacterium]|nr:ribonuclease III [Alphaproteobacteria bacterium]